MATNTVASDTLTTGGTSDLAGRTADVGGDWVETLNDSTTKGIVDAVAVAAKAAGLDNSNKMFYSLGAPTTPDYDVEVTLQALSGGDDPIGILGRYQDASNFYFLRDDGRLIRRTAGVFTELFRMSPIPAAGNAYRLRMLGTLISADLDTGSGFVDRGSIVDSDHVLTGLVGLGWGSLYAATHDIEPKGEFINYRVSDEVAAAASGPPRPTAPPFVFV